MSKTLLRHTLIKQYFWYLCWLPYLYTFSRENYSFIIVSAETEYISTRSWYGFVTRLTRRVPLVEQELLTLPKHLSSLPVFSGVRVTRSLVWVRARLFKLQKGCTRLAAASDQVYQWLVHGPWFSPASSTTKTGRHDIAEILLKVAWLVWVVRFNDLIHWATR
jgi:hypothetical protein